MLRDRELKDFGANQTKDFVKWGEEDEQLKGLLGMIRKFRDDELEQV